MNGDPLQKMLSTQKDFISKWVDFRKVEEDPQQFQKIILDYIGHTIEELIELRRLLPIRKHWKKHQEPLDLEKIREEYIDGVHFMLNIGIIIGLTKSEDFFKEYQKKHEINVNRQKTGY